MGLFTELPLADARRLAAEFGVDVARVSPLAAGSVNSNFALIAADGRKYFARIYEEQGRDGALGELRLLAELAREGVPVPVPLTRQGGGGPLDHGGKPFAVYPWIDGEIVCQARVTPEHVARVGEALARIHLSTPRLSPLGAGRFRVEDLGVRLDRIEAESPEHAGDAREIRKKLAHYAARRDPSVPRGVIHGDLFRDNALFRGGRIAALIDFESASTGPFAFDVMVTLLAWCYGDRFREDLVKAFLGAYTALRPMDPPERAALLVEGAIACLRFATTRITDFAMRTPPGEKPKRDHRRFLSRLAELEDGILERCG